MTYLVLIALHVPVCMLCIMMGVDRLHSGAPSGKLVVGISTRARTWKLDGESEIAGVPPLHADGPGEAGTLLWG